MAIDPEDIERAVFKERFRGYDQDQVDRFLDQVSAGLNALRAERDALAAEVEALRGGASPAASGGEHVDGLISRTLSAAQRTAEEVVTEARRQAAEVLDDARRRAERERGQTRAEAELVRRAVGELKAFRDEYRARLHAIMSEQLAALDRAGELPRLPAVVEQLGEAPAAAPDAGFAPMPPASAEPPREPSPARAWAAAAERDVEEASEDPAAGGDELASPWDDLWHGRAEPEVDPVPEPGTNEPAGAWLPEASGRPGAPADPAGDA